MTRAHSDRLINNNKNREVCYQLMAAAGTDLLSIFNAVIFHHKLILFK